MSAIEGNAGHVRGRPIHGLFRRRCKADNLAGSLSPTALSAAFNPFVWEAAHVSAIGQARLRDAPLIEAGDFARISPEIDLWDAWPVQDVAGNPAVLGDRDTLWMALAAPHRDDPDERHGLARIHLFQCGREGWRHLGPLFPEGFTPGSREWSGSAVLADDGRSLTIYFTATGVRGEGTLSFGQRLFSARATLQALGDGYRFGEWRDLTEFVSREPAWYMASEAGTGSVGTIKAFRDPAYFFDAASGEHWMFFAASLANSTSPFNGAVGAAVSTDPAREKWTILPPVVSADGLNNELERPHVVVHGGSYYLFWSTQAHVFNPDGPVGPTGLYGLVSDRLDGGWRPLNGTGLVFANPPEAPAQAYSWLVLPDLSVTSFVDNWGREPAEPRRFGASFAPALHLRLDGANAVLAD